MAKLITTVIKLLGSGGMAKASPFLRSKNYPLEVGINDHGETTQYKPPFLPGPAAYFAKRLSEVKKAMGANWRGHPDFGKPTKRIDDATK